MTCTLGVLFVASMAMNTILVHLWGRSLRVRLRDLEELNALEIGMRHTNQFFLRCMRAEDEGRDPRLDADAMRAYRASMAQFRQSNDTDKARQRGAI